MKALQAHRPLEIWLIYIPNKCLLKKKIITIIGFYMRYDIVFIFQFEDGPAFNRRWWKVVLCKRARWVQNSLSRTPPWSWLENPLTKEKKNGAKGPDALVEARKNQVSSIASWNERSPTLLARIVWRGRCKQPLKGWATPRVWATWWFLMTNCREMSLRGDKLRRIKFRCSRSKLVGCIIDWR